MLEFPCLFSLAPGDADDANRHSTHTLTIWGLSTLLIVMPNLVEIILVELANEAGEVAVFEVLWEDGFCKSFVLR